jgi:hypothetical protein
MGHELKGYIWLNSYEIALGLGDRSNMRKFAEILKAVARGSLNLFWRYD